MTSVLAAFCAHVVMICEVMCDTFHNDYVWHALKWSAFALRHNEDEFLRCRLTSPVCVRHFAKLI